MIAVGSIVRGNWSSMEYRADHVWEQKDEGYWCINGKSVDNPLVSGSFTNLGKRVGNEIEILDPKRPKDRLVIVLEKSSAKLQRKDLGKQMTFGFSTA